MFRRMISMVLVCAITMGLCMSPALAVTDHMDDGSTQYPIEMEYNAEQFVSLFQDGRMPLSDNNELKPEASYEYEIYNNEDDERCVDLTLTLSYGGVSHTLYATGTIVSYRMPDNRMMQSGPLEGTLTVDGVDYLFMIGFHQYENEDRAHFTANITQLSGEGDLMMIEFGEDIISPETREKLPGFFRVDEDEGDAISQSPRGARYYSQMGYKREKYISGDNIKKLRNQYAQRLIVYFKPAGRTVEAGDKNLNIMTVGVKSYLDDLENTYASKLSTYGYGYVSKIRIDVDSDNRNCAMDRFYELDVSSTGKNNVKVNALVGVMQQLLRFSDAAYVPYITPLVTILRAAAETTTIYMSNSKTSSYVKNSFTPYEASKTNWFDDAPYMVGYVLDGGDTFDYPFTISSELTAGFIDEGGYSHFTKADTATLTVTVPYVDR